MVNNSITKEIREFCKLSLKMADLAEDILESKGDYSKEFVQGVEASLEDERDGKVRKIDTLTNLS
jgi:hypothetical protein